MESSEKIERLLKDDWEINGDPKSLCLLLRDYILAWKRMVDHVAKNTKDEWASQYLQWRMRSKAEQTAIVIEENQRTMEAMLEDPETNKTEPTCRTCRFWRVTYEHDLKDEFYVAQGTCRFEPPKLNLGFPVVYSNSWCAKQEQKESK